MVKDIVHALATDLDISPDNFKRDVDMSLFYLIVVLVFMAQIKMTRFSSNLVLQCNSAALACATFLSLFNLERYIFLPRAHPVFPNVYRGGTHRWGLS